MIKKVNENNTNINTYYLSGGFQYEEIITSTTSQMPQLKFFPHVEGYVNVEQGRSTSYFNYVFNYTDHLGNIRLSYGYDPSIQTTKIIEENHYYAFGLKHTGYNSHLLLWMEDIDTDRISLQQSQIKTAAPAFVPKSSGYQYKYNGKELQTELGLNMYDYGARNYDAALGRWMNMDNLAEKFITFSPYHYAGNNPISNIDVDGNEFTEAMQEWINKLISEINSRQSSNNKKIEEARKIIASGKYGWLQSEKSLTKKIEKLTEQNNELNIVSDEISELECSTQVYDLVYDSNGTQRDYATGSSTTSNTTGFNFTNGNVEITISSGTSIGLFAHELKHAFQFEKGEYSVGPELPKNTPYFNFFYDQQDEIAAHNRGALFGESFNGTLSSTYSSYATGPYDYRNIKETRSAAAANRTDVLQNVSSRTGHAFRINGKTYYEKR